MARHTILVVDDEAPQREALSGFLKKKGFNILTADGGIRALDTVKDQAVDMILTDMRMPELDGLQLLRAARDINPNIEVVVMTAYGSIENAIQAMKDGASDFITKPVDLEQLQITVNKVLQHKQLVDENQRLKEMVKDRFNFSGIITKGEAMNPPLSIASRAAQSKATVLVTGESGTGKELVARAIHFASPRAEKAFVAVNMAALSDNLVESELFGHEKGAFTGADKLRLGRFESAHEGTLFIDEVGEIPLSTQVKLLRVLQEQQIERIGSSNPVKVDVRVIAATNRSLEDMVQEGTFREDLYYRLNVVKIELPPLRERKSDIPTLADHFIKKYAEMNGKPVSGISNDALDTLIKYRFPGNVRELENIMEQAVVLCRDDVIAYDDLPLMVTQNASAIRWNLEEGTFQERVEAFEQMLIREALEKHNSVQTHAAESLGMTERHLRYKMQKYGMKK